MTERGELLWTVDLPALIRELALANLELIGPGAAYGLAITEMYLANIATIAARQDNQEILVWLERLGIVSKEADKLRSKPLPKPEVNHDQ